MLCRVITQQTGHITGAFDFSRGMRFLFFVLCFDSDKIPFTDRPNLTQQNKRALVGRIYTSGTVKPLHTFLILIYSTLYK